VNEAVENDRENSHSGSGAATGRAKALMERAPMARKVSAALENMMIGDVVGRKQMTTAPGLALDKGTGESCTAAKETRGVHLDPFIDCWEPFEWGKSDMLSILGLPLIGR